MRPTRLVVDTAKLRMNLRKIKDALPEWRTCTAVVKANGYGHGSVVVSRIAAEEGYEAVAVAVPEEAMTLRRAGIMLPIYLLGITLPQSYDLVIKSQSIPAIDESTDIEALQAYAAQEGVTVRCAVAIDTGMHRIGLRPDRVLAFLERLESMPNLVVDGFFSHMANADAADKTHAKSQIALFDKTVDAIKAKYGDDFRFSLANSAGLLVLPDSHFTDARVGIIQYGIMPSLDVPNRLGLEPVLSFYSKVVHTQIVPAGEGVGYGSTYVAPCDVKVATIPVGYADGYPRSLSNRGSVLIRGQRCPIVGRICMDQLMVLVPDSMDVQPGEEVVLIGNQGHESITALEIATLTGTIPYEIFCNISERVPREYIYTGDEM